MLLCQFRASNQCGYFLLFNHLPINIFFDIRMVDIDSYHLCGPACCAPGFNRSGGPVTNFQKAHQARRLAATRQAFTRSAQAREVRPGTGTIFEQSGFAYPQIHNPAFIDQIIIYRLDETGMWLRMFIRGFGAHHFASLVINIKVTLARPINTIGPMQTGIKPLRRVWRGHLHGQHKYHLVIICFGIVLGGEIPAFPCPVGPGTGKPVEHLFGRGLTAIALIFLQLGQRLFVW